MPLNSNVYCPVCRTTVAKFDPERVQVELSVYHRHCLNTKNGKTNSHVRQPTYHRQPCSCVSCVGHRLNAM